MAINKNDCLDCANLYSVDIWNARSPVKCDVTGIVLASCRSELEVFEHDCPNFKYEE